jgi:hypothetical protein
MSVMGQMMKAKKTEITDKLRQEINKARASGLQCACLWLGLTRAFCYGAGGQPLHRHRRGRTRTWRALH